jgi:hypothetical protein
MSVHRPFSAVSTLSSTFPPFSGIKLTQNDYIVNSENRITLTVPSLSSKGNFDIVVENQAGYNSLLHKLPVI